MSGPLLAPLGRAEPDDVRGWIELGGLFRLQLALAMTPDAIRRRLSLASADRAAIRVAIGPSPDPARTLVEELPAWLVEGALLLALSQEQRTATLHLVGADPDHERLLDTVIDRLARLGIIGAGSLSGVRIVRADRAAPEGALDALMARRLTLRVAGEDDSTTLAALTGPVGRPEVIELRLDRPLGEQLGYAAHRYRIHVDGRPIDDGESSLRELVGDDWSGRIEVSNRPE